MLSASKTSAWGAGAKGRNLVIIAALVGLTPLFEGQDRVYAYAIGVLVGTVVQFVLRGRGCAAGGAFSLALDWRNPHCARS